MRVKCIRTFLNAQTGKLWDEGGEYEATPERVAEINGTRYGQLVEAMPEKPEAMSEEPRRRKARIKDTE